MEKMKNQWKGIDEKDILVESKFAYGELFGK